MPVVHLVRHGQASYGAADYDVLSELGRHQADLVGAVLAERVPDPALVASGALRRQLDTLAHVRKATGWAAEPVVDPRWNEVDPHDVIAAHGPPPGPDGTVWARTLPPALGGWVAAGESSPAAESWPAFRTRVGAALADAFAALPEGGAAVVVTSGGVIAALCATTLGVPAAGFMALTAAHVNTGVTTLAAGRSGVTVVTFNDHGHLLRDRDRLLTYR